MSRREQQSNLSRFFKSNRKMDIGQVVRVQGRELRIKTDTQKYAVIGEAKTGESVALFLGANTTAIATSEESSIRREFQQRRYRRRGVTEPPTAFVVGTWFFDDGQGNGGGGLEG